MVHCFQQLAQALDHGPAVLATVTQVTGSVPREVGAKLVLDAQGHTHNTVGGGAGEAKVIRQAQEILKTGDKQWVDIDLSGAPQRPTQGVCGGYMQVWVERWQGPGAKALVAQILQRLRLGQAVTLATPLLLDGTPYLVDTAAPQPDSATTFVEILQPPPTLLIIGAGHVGIQLAKVGDLIGFQVMVQDDRPDWANARNYPQASQILAQPVGDAIAPLATHQNLYAALVTRGYTYDLEALEQLLQRSVPCRYIGMIGSKKRVHQVFQALQERGIPQEKLSPIYAPIGLDIGALTPEEIAVSIGAELILVRRRAGERGS
ncbi:MAG: XdhC family protein [Leptolyngbyaceae cyanobacterium SM2_3_12]|nr:XdhC family protein [Leptolyngbyaceae cyanobacterium SM2_3_12]